MELAKIVIGIRRIAFIAGRMFSKLKGEEKAVVLLVSFAVLLVPILPLRFSGPSSSKASLGKVSVKTDDATSAATRWRKEQEAQIILAQIQQKYNFSRFIDT